MTKKKIGLNETVLMIVTGLIYLVWRWGEISWKQIIIIAVIIAALGVWMLIQIKQKNEERIQA